MPGQRSLLRDAAAAVVLPLALCAMPGGCDKPAAHHAGGPAPATQPSASPSTRPTLPPTRPTTRAVGTQPTTAPLTQAATTEPALSFLVVDGRLVEFPAAKIILTRKDGRLKARLFSDNPKSALEENYAGNSFYFDMPLDADPEQPGQWVWRFKSADSEASDSPNGVYLNGLKTHLQPFDVLVQVDGHRPRVNVQVVPPSQFRAFDKDAPADTSRLVTVNGNLVAEVVEKQR